jgi:hypothetical protein
VTARIACGYSIEVNRKALYSDPPTTVRLHKLGCAESSWMTPDELTTFIAALNDALADARKDK